MTLNRRFVICLGQMEENFKSEDKENWKQYIDVNKMMNVAKQLI